MLNKQNINQIFEALNFALKQKSQKEHLYIFGSAALIALDINVGERKTRDVDVLSPCFDNEMVKIVESVGAEFGLLKKRESSDEG